MSQPGYRRYRRDLGNSEYVETRIAESPIPTKLKLLLADYYWKKQARVANQLGIAPATFNRYVNGTIPIAAEHLVRLCRLFRLGPEDIVGFADKDFIDIA